MILEKLGWKLFFKNQNGINPSDFFNLFDSWIAGSPYVFVDVADYEHVEDGPKTILVGHYADVILDHSDRKWGLIFMRKRWAEKSKNPLQYTLKETLDHAKKVQAAFPQYAFDTTALQLIVNDRAGAPNTETTHTEIKPLLDALAHQVWPQGQIKVERNPNPRLLYSVLLSAESTFTLDQLLGHL